MRLVGYENITYFYKVFKEKYKMTPYDYRHEIKIEKKYLNRYFFSILVIIFSYKS
jgi:AraC-like DNA-binding protein